MIAVLLIVGISYIFYRYSSVSNKSFFFKSPFFKSLAGSIGIILSSIGFVTFFGQGDRQSEKDDTRVRHGDTVKIRMDTSSYYLLSQSAAFHFAQIKAIRRQHDVASFYALQESYERLAGSSVDSISSLGNFGLGVLAYVDNQYSNARQFFVKVKNRQLPGLHFCQAEIFASDKKQDDAITEYKKEFQINGGLHSESAKRLIVIFDKLKNYDELYRLYQNDFAAPHFSEELARLTLLHAIDTVGYFTLTVRIISHHVHWIGFVAASLISVIWLIYIFNLNAYSRSKLLILFGVFAGGAICTPLTIVFYDAVGLFTQWGIENEFINDILYSIFIIGVAEEFVKILPFLVVLLFVNRFKEPIDYIICASAGALGFAFIENLIYFKEIDGSIIHGRAYFSVIGHMIDSSFIAYGFVIGLFKKKDKSTLSYLVPIYFLLAALVHGLYDFFLFEEWLIIFFIYFIFIVQVWVIVINNCLNNSDSFTYKHARRASRSRAFITLSLVGIFSFEYVTTGFSSSASEANRELLRNAGFVSFIIIFFSSNLSSFDLINDYWRSISFKDQEKRGYGGRGKRHPLLRWYFANLVMPHNYVGLKVLVYNDPYNRVLINVLDKGYRGKVYNRIILYKDDVPDPHWFLIKMEDVLPFAKDRPDYILVKLRFQEDSLFEQDEVQVFFKSIVDAMALRDNKPDKDAFPSYGWAYIKLDTASTIASE